MAEPLQRRSAEEKARHGFALIEERTATPEMIALVEHRMGVIFSDKYKAVMARYGGGLFGFVELLPIVEPEKPARYGDVWTENDRRFPERDFVAVAAVGTGDYCGYLVADGRCHEQVWFQVHDDNEHELVAADLLEFIAEYGLKSSTDRALERRDR
ncbi:SMI1/KNR4 family protein [Dactylosporangium matsuzakiense]|uniref:Knr4/Smi1-like domain-containing protein n=1 Tax=Dactylosporangium matsuzakiense TaxID=53360 RepID=A0A9W6KYI6_9ACTN|nr:SMI1/KNR4 family protein [Dactylosporangium matsuzakiense]UWZ44702.1 SMI1/KNR4 family protein [Dactylosporangium matsuzakiense]GLL08780.1 hypothetical protein GCM10017581_105540 [Dactylosporangium matsuzakiense]